MHRATLARQASFTSLFNHRITRLSDDNSLGVAIPKNKIKQFNQAYQAENVVLYFLKKENTRGEKTDRSTATLEIAS